MKDWIKLLFVALLGGSLGGFLIIYIRVGFVTDWTAVACLISVIALIVTIVDNRIRFKKDSEIKLRVSNANELMSLVSEFLVAYKSCFRYTSSILKRNAQFETNENFRKETLKFLRQRSENRFDISLIMLKIDMIHIRLEHDLDNHDLFVLCSELEGTDNQVFEELNARTLSDWGLDNEQVLQVVKKGINTRQNQLDSTILNIQKESAKLFKELTNPI